MTDWSATNPDLQGCIDVMRQLNGVMPGRMVVSYEAARQIYQRLPWPRHTTEDGFIACLEMGEVVLSNGTVVEAGWL